MDHAWSRSRHPHATGRGVEHVGHRTGPFRVTARALHEPHAATAGGFYKQFSSKEALAAEATGQAFAEFLGQLPERDPDRPEDHVAARTALLDHYFSPEHRDDPGTGCPVSALAADLAHEAADSPVRAIYVKGAEDLAQWLTTDGDEDLATLSTMVGALLLARATSGTGLSGRVLAAARASIET